VKGCCPSSFSLTSPTDVFFRFVKGGPGGKGLSTGVSTGLRGQLEALCKKAGIPPVGFHAIRRGSADHVC